MKTFTAIVSTFQIIGVTFFALDSVSATEPVFACVGTEPFYSLKIHPKGILLFEPLGDANNTETRFHPVTPNATYNTNLDYLRIYETRGFDGKDAKFIVQKMACSDGMSDNKYKYQLIVLSESRGNFLGCCNIKKN
jgi:uncharacterized membrane protein